MKTTLFLFVALVCSISFTSCEKDDPDTPEYPITGLWIGTYSVITGAEPGDSLYYSFFIATDSTIQMQGLGADGNTYYGLGKWTHQGNSFSATFTTSNFSQQGVVQKVTAVQDKTRLTGVVETVDGPFRADFHLSRTE